MQPLSVQAKCILKSVTVVFRRWPDKPGCGTQYEGGVKIQALQPANVLPATLQAIVHRFFVPRVTCPAFRDFMTRYRTLSIIALIILALDQATKLYVDANFRLNESLPVIDGFFHLTYVRNKGAAFGILAENAVRIPFFITVSSVAMIGILWYIKRIRDDQKLVFFALSLIFSGAFGNLIDRIRYGEVIDFLDIFWKSYHWPAFNVADSAITIGVTLLFIEMWFEDRNKPATQPAHKSEERDL
jgi:signal peptidase II